MGGLKEFKILHICFFITFVLVGLGINLLQALLTLLLPKRLFHRANYYTVAGILGYFVCLADWWGGATFTIHCSDEFHEKLKKKSFKEDQLVLVNHHTELDWLYCWQLTDRAGMIGGSRALAKNVLQYLPVIGWSSMMSGDVFLSRSWEKDKVHIKKMVDALKEQPYPTNLFVFPEGTRINEKKHKASQEFASQRGLPHLEHHLIPRTKGFSLVAAHSEGGLLDITFVQAEDSAQPTLASMLNGHRVHTRVFVREYRMTEVPKGEKESGEWLMDLFKEKDAIKAAALAKDWKTLATLGSFTERESPPRSWSVWWTAVTNILVLCPLMLLVLQGGMWTCVVTLVILSASWLGLTSMMSVSKIKKE